MNNIPFYKDLNYYTKVIWKYTLILHPKIAI